MSYWRILVFFPCGFQTPPYTPFFISARVHNTSFISPKHFSSKDFTSIVTASDLRRRSVWFKNVSPRLYVTDPKCSVIQTAFYNSNLNINDLDFKFSSHSGVCEFSHVWITPRCCNSNVSTCHCKHRGKHPRLRCDKEEPGHEVYLHEKILILWA